MHNGKKINHLYHIWADGLWQGVVEEHISALKNSKLLEKIDFFYVGIVGEEKNRLDVKNFLNNKNVNFIIINECETGFEQETLNAALGKKFEGLLFYAHTKGAFRTSNFENVWRGYLNQYLIFDWKSCFDLLSKYSMVGCEYVIYKDKKEVVYDTNIYHDHGVYYSNFWWTHGEYLENIDQLLTDNRNYATFIPRKIRFMLIKEGKVFSAYDKNPIYKVSHEGLKWFAIVEPDISFNSKKYGHNRYFSNIIKNNEYYSRSMNGIWYKVNEFIPKKTKKEDSVGKDK
jgi:hypothetical protein